MSDFENKIVLGMTDAEYHADPCVTPSLSAGVAKVMLAKSPMHARHIHPRMGGHDKRSGEAADFGSVVHSLVLGMGKAFDVLDVDAYRSNADKALRDASVAAGRTPIKRKEYDVAERVAEALRNRLNLSGENEVTVVWSTHANDGTEIQCRSRLDNVTERDGFAIITDIKTTGIGADERSMIKACEPDGQDYAVQMFSQIMALEKVRPDYAGRIQYRWCFVETEAPYGIRLAQPSGAMMALGGMRWGRAVETWARCVSSGQWPGYPDDVALLAPRDFAMSNEETANANV